MRRCGLILLMLLACGCQRKVVAQTGQSQDAMPEIPEADLQLPGPARAAAAAARVTPGLKRKLEAKGLALGAPVFLRVVKDEKLLELWLRKGAAYELFHAYPVQAASGHAGPKLAEGDMQVPEGFYAVSRDTMKPDSAFHLAFNIGYPNAYDRAHGRTGSFIMVHGNALSVGCLAMGDPAIEEIYTLCNAALTRGQPFFRVHVFPFRMTPERMAQEANGEWIEFWNNLKDGYDAFEKDRVPPEIEVVDKRYIIKGAAR